MKTTAKSITVAALLLTLGHSAASAFYTKADTVEVKTDSVNVEKKAAKKHECCQDTTVKDHTDPYHKVVKEGGSVRFLTAGGGGFGDPKERDPEKIKWDLKEGYITPEQAREDYGYTE